MNETEIKLATKQAIYTAGYTIREVATNVGIIESNLSRCLSTSATSRPLTSDMLESILKVIGMLDDREDGRVIILMHAGLIG